MQFSLFGCLNPSGGGQGTDTATTSSSSSSTTTGDSTTSGIQTVTGGTTGGLPPKPQLEQTCEDCGFPVSVRTCWCVDNGNLLDQPWGCLDDPAFEATAQYNCGLELGHAPSVEEFFCMQPVCPMPGEFVGLCDTCGEAALVRYHCKHPQEMEERWGEYACNDMFEIVFKNKCAEELGVDIEALTTAHFFKSTHMCPGFDTTGGDPTTGGTTTGGDTTTGGSTTGDSTTGEPLVDCDDWRPARAITLRSGVYEIDTAFVDDLLVNPEPLLFCDEARFIMLPLGFQLQAASAGQLFYELGLRDNDFPLALNGYPVTDIGEVLVALGELWYIEGETDYQLAVYRGSSVVTLHYSLN